MWVCEWWCVRTGSSRLLNWTAWSLHPPGIWATREHCLANWCQNIQHTIEIIKRASGWELPHSAVAPCYRELSPSPAWSTPLWNTDKEQGVSWNVYWEPESGQSIPDISFPSAWPHHITPKHQCLRVTSHMTSTSEDFFLPCPECEQMYSLNCSQEHLHKKCGVRGIQLVRKNISILRFAPEFIKIYLWYLLNVLWELCLLWNFERVDKCKCKCKSAVPWMQSGRNILF